MHKILAGLIDIYELEGNSDALAVASSLGTWLYNRANGWSSAAKSRVLGQEYGGMNDALYELYKLTKNPNHLTVAHVFDDTSLFTTLAGGTDNLSGKHANMTIPKFIGALNRYRVVGSSESAYLNAATGFFTTVLGDHTYVTGGNSEDEHFHTPKALNQYRDNVNDETCNAYNMTKLTRDLFMVTGDVKYADFYERIHINEVLASMNPDTGMTTYFKPMGTGYFKAFGTPTDSFWCCTGTGMENFTRLDDSVYFHDAKNLWVTYYVSSTLNWSERGLSLTQTTDLPLSNKVNFTINSAPTDAVTLSFRKPDWTSSCQMAISVNGQAVSATASGGFITVNRVWNAGDKVVIAFPLFLSVSRTPDNQNVVAFTYGPLVLSAGLGTASMTTTTHAATIAATSPGGLQDTIKVNSPTAVNDWLANINSNLVQTAGQLTFTPKGTDSDSKLVFIPHYSRYKDRYGIYWIMSGASGGSTSTTVSCPAVDANGTGGAGGSGGAAGSSGSSGASGKGGSGGATGSGGSSSSGGATGSGGSSSSGGAIGSGGSSSSGGAIGSGGSLGSGGSSSGFGGSAPGDAGRGSSGCSCAVAESASGATSAAWLFAVALLLGYRRQRR
jgi:MYXO-CTERM domain-containing protein